MIANPSGTQWTSAHNSELKSDARTRRTPTALRETCVSRGGRPSCNRLPTTNHQSLGIRAYRGVGRGCGVGRGLGVTLGVAVGVGVPVGVGLTVAVGVGVGVGVADCS